MSQDLREHYRALLDLLPPWVVTNVSLKLLEKRVEISISWPEGHLVPCPECQAECPLHDHRASRQWRHLDTMQFQTIIISEVPRSNCPKHGIKTVQIPWAAPHGRFTLMFEAFVIEVLKATKNVREAANLLGLSWDQVRDIQSRAVERGLKRREVDQLKHLGIDEKSFLKGHQYASIMVDLDGHRVLDVVQDRTLEAVNKLWEGLPLQARRQVEAVAMDMWAPFKTATESHAPQAAIVHDKFHVSKYLNEAVDQVRRAEHKELSKYHDETLKGSKYLFLKDQKNWNEKERQRFEELQDEGLKVGRAWAIKQVFMNFWTMNCKQSAKEFFKQWYFWATHSQLKPVIKVAKMLKRHFSNLLTYLNYPISNGMVEGFNSKIQMIKSNARSFRSFKNYRMLILCVCGKLNMAPINPHKCL